MNIAQGNLISEQVSKIWGLETSDLINLEDFDHSEKDFKKFESEIKYEN